MKFNKFLFLIQQKMYGDSGHQKRENKENNDEVSSINTEELEFKESSEELYKYIKKKLVVKLFILILMEVLKECKKEEYIENRKSYFDHYINECKTDENSAKIPEITKKIKRTNNIVL
ncbi:hypothetical protein MKS88_002615 [Plasmodium brasilianum]|uniref:Uncharacterized protein n=1 Tax=Plasmodium brasilianum TaxID=5824 RepID=A0ACB9YCL5_PLABR|nr:hypothetical protein MKS88_002615 [Plasmodium brasilianum]